MPCFEKRSAVGTVFCYSSTRFKLWQPGSSPAYGYIFMLCNVFRFTCFCIGSTLLPKRSIAYFGTCRLILLPMTSEWCVAVVVTVHIISLLVAFIGRDVLTKIGKHFPGLDNFCSVSVITLTTF